MKDEVFLAALYRAVRALGWLIPQTEEEVEEEERKQPDSGGGDEVQRKTT